MLITSDHGNDPTSESTDHSREFVPVLLFPSSRATSVNLGTRETFSDIACTVADYFGVSTQYVGTSMLKPSENRKN